MRDSAGSHHEELVRARVDKLLAEHPPEETALGAFLGAQFDEGLAWVDFPEGLGGLGASPRLQVLVGQALETAEAPDPMYRNPIGVGMAAPTILAHGCDQHHRRWLRPLFTCEEIWCQLFSEPGAGSDVASLATRAVRDGDGWRVNGQKVWTTLAHAARWGLLVARTDPRAPKHRGLSYFVLDMEADGVEVRPLRQITGEAEFNEVYMTDVWVPDSHRLGGIGEGWNVALTTLMNERTALGGTGTTPRGAGPIAEAVDLYRRLGDGAGPARDRLMRLWVEAEVLRLTQIRATKTRQRGIPGPEGSTVKLASAELNQRVRELCVTLMGASAMLMPIDSYRFRRPDPRALIPEATDARQAFLRSRGNTIEGGTSEIMRNILGERVLGLPGEPRPDKGRPWSEVPKN